MKMKMKRDHVEATKWVLFFWACVAGGVGCLCVVAWAPLVAVGLCLAVVSAGIYWANL
jgi:hypothetical protein